MGEGARFRDPPVKGVWGSQPRQDTALDTRLSCRLSRSINRIETSGSGTNTYMKKGSFLVFIIRFFF